MVFGELFLVAMVFGELFLVAMVLGEDVSKFT